MFSKELDNIDITIEENSNQKLFPHFRTLKGQIKYFQVYAQALQQLWPIKYEEKDVETKYGTTHIIISGKEDAPPLYLLHNSGSTSLIWYQIVQELCMYFRIYCIDILCDIGKSIPKNPPKTEEQLADWLEQVMLADDMTQAYIAGLSYGGFACMNFALLKPSRVKKLILLAPAATILPLTFRFWYITGRNVVFPLKRNTPHDQRKNGLDRIPG